MNFIIYFRPFPETNADEKQTNGADVKVDETNSDSHASVTSQKYSQILGDHTNSSTNQFSRNSSHHTYKPRGYNNKENFYNQRAVGRPGYAQRSWQRGSNYRTPLVNGKDKKPEENASSDAKADSTAEPIKFNEGKSPQTRHEKHFRSPVNKIFHLSTKISFSAPINNNI